MTIYHYTSNFFRQWINKNKCKCIGKRKTMPIQNMIFVITTVKKSLYILFYVHMKLPSIKLSNRHVLILNAYQSDRMGKGCDNYYYEYNIQGKKGKRENKKALKKLGNNSSKDGVKK